MELLKNVTGARFFRHSVYYVHLYIMLVTIVIYSSCLEVPYLLNLLFTGQLRLFCFRFYLLLLPFGE